MFLALQLSALYILIRMLTTKRQYDELMFAMCVSYLYAIILGLPIKQDAVKMQRVKSLLMLLTKDE